MTIPARLLSLESEVRSYSRSWPVVFDRAVGPTLRDLDGRSYLDFFAGAGSLNYGHNNPVLKLALLDHLDRDAVVQGLDTMTDAKAEFLETFDELILGPRDLDYKVQFTGPTGADAVEAALKLARKVTGRTGVVAFTGAYHGLSLGALAVTGHASKRAAAGVPLGHTLRLPYCGFGDGVSGLSLLEHYLRDSGSGVELPAAVIVETVQAEGGLHTATAPWLQELAGLCARWGILLIVDDIQVGCGRTGGFFSFEEAGIVPDLVVLSKSISGYGLPMALTLLRPDLDVWQPGEDNGGFRGDCLAFAGATAALQSYWPDRDLEKQTLARGEHVRHRLGALGLPVRGRGLINGLVLPDSAQARAVCDESFHQGLIVETSGSSGEVVKVLPPLTIPDADLDAGLDTLCAAVRGVRGA